MTKKPEKERLYAGYHFEEILRCFADTINRTCFMHSNNYEDAKDCFQNTFLKLYISDKEFESKEHIKAWLLTVALHECLDVYRQSWKSKTNLCEDMNTIMMQKKLVMNADDNTDDATLAIVLSLPIKYRRVIYLYYYEEYSIADIAKMLELSENTVKTQLVRGRDKINQKISQQGNERYRRYIV